MRLNLLLCLLLCAAGLSAQNTRPDYLHHYYPVINRAELLIVDGRYGEALQRYDSAFRSCPRAFSKDYYNAAVCAVKTGREGTAYRFLDSLILRGTSRQFLDTTSVLATLRAQPSWASYMNAYDGKLAVGKARRDEHLEHLLELIQQRDQDYRKRPGSYKVWGDSVRIADSLNLLAVQEIIRSTGFPNERMVTRPNPKNAMMPAYIFFHHHCQGRSLKREGYDFYPDFVQAVSKGELDPYLMADLLKMHNDKTQDAGGMALTVYVLNDKESKLLGDFMLPEQKQRVEALRAQFGMSTLAEYYRKALFALRTREGKDFAFGLYGRINKWPVESQEELDRVVKGSVSLED